MAASRVFISYRRDDAFGAGLVHSEMARRVGDKRIFMDVRDLGPGENFASGILASISQSDVVLAIIGSGWITSLSRLDDEEDWVRQELATAIASGARVVPVLLDDTGMPSSDDLPPALQGLAGLQAYAIDNDHVGRDVNDLLAALSIRKSKRTSIAAGIVVSVAVVAAAVAFNIYSADTGPYYNNTELIFDTSVSMADFIPSGDGSQSTNKLAVAQDQVIEYVGKRTGDNLALRTSAGCDIGGNLVVPFQTGAAAAITESLAAVVLSGASFGLADAVIAATGDFNDPEQFPPETERQIIVFTSGGDECESDPVALLAERWEELGDIRLAVEFIGMGLSDADAESQLSAMANAVGGRAFIVEDQEQLNRLLAQLLDVEPVQRALGKIIDTGNSIVYPLRDLRAALNRCDVGAAREAISMTEVALSAAGPALRSLRDRDDRPSYSEVHAAAQEWADTLGDGLEVGKRRTELLADRVGEASSDEACDEFLRSDEWNESTDEWNEAVGIANDTLGKVSDRQDLLTAELEEILNS